MPRYNPAEIEPKWQKYWDTHKTFAAPELPGSRKLYVLDMFPYPSGDGLHVGHPEGYTATDIVCRFYRMRGWDCLHPMGFDAFGLPAEEHAISTGEHPRIQTEKNIANFTRQLKMLGFSYDWDRSLATTDVDYVHWTQWIFLVLYDTWFDFVEQKGRPISELPIPGDVAAEGNAAIERYRDAHRLAYEDDALVNWCPALGTVLANEEVQDGRSERGNHPVQRLPLRQWMLRITAYAERLLDGLDDLQWPSGIKKLQQDWIGKSEGAEVDFFIGAKEAFAAWAESRANGGFPSEPDDALRVYTTRPDTLFGATYMVIAPEHPLVDSLTTDECREEVTKYCQAASFKSDRERTEGDKTKTGVFTGSYAINPVNQSPIPIWIADYVLASYGTGAIMAVPAHDTRDYEFAERFGLPIVRVVEPPQDFAQLAEVIEGTVCFSGLGTAVASGPYEGLPTEEVKEKITEDLHSRGVGRAAINFKLRDWLFSRQRFWGEPFPVLHEVDANGNRTGRKRTVPAEHLPVDLPHLDDFKPHGRPEPPLEKAAEDWLFVEIDGVRYKRETNTMPQWAGSCWYFLRYIDPKNPSAFVDPAKEQAWMPVDLYVGGAEHAVLHLLYSRFWHKVLFDRGYVSTPEPFRRLVNQGMILGEMEYTALQSERGDFTSFERAKKNDEGQWVSEGGVLLEEVKLDEAAVQKSGDHFVLANEPAIRVDARCYKMSKSRGNVVNPDAIVREYGADALRLYEMFMGPLEATKPWSMAGVGGVRNFLDRVWRMIVDGNSEEPLLSSAVVDVALDEESRRMLHKTIRAVTEDTEAMSFNTAIARMMEFTNFFTRMEQRPREAMESFVLLLSPYAPHMSEELWRVLGHENTLAYEAWPQWDPAALVLSEVELPVQINGKVRAKVKVPAEASEDDVFTVVLANERVRGEIEGKDLVKKIYIPGRMVTLAVRG